MEVWNSISGQIKFSSVKPSKQYVRVDGKGEELLMLEDNKHHFCTHVAKWPDLEAEVNTMETIKFLCLQKW